MSKKACIRPNGFKNNWGFTDNFGKLVPIAEQNRKSVEDKIDEVKEEDKVVKAGKFVKNGNKVNLELKVANSSEVINIDASSLNETQAVNAEKARAQKAEKTNSSAIKSVDSKVNVVNAKVKAVDAKVKAVDAKIENVDEKIAAAEADAIAQSKEFTSEKVLSLRIDTSKALNSLGRSINTVSEKVDTAKADAIAQSKEFTTEEVAKVKVEAGKGLEVSAEDEHKFDIKAADNSILVGEEGVKVNPDVLTDNGTVVMFEDFSIPESEAINEVVKSLTLDLGYDDASKGYLWVFRSTNNQSDVPASSFQIAKDAFLNNKPVTGFIQLGEKNYIKVEGMSYCEEDDILRLFGHTGSVGSEYDGSKYGGYDSISALENYVEVLLMEGINDENDEYMFDSVVLFRPLQGAAINAQFIEWTDAELEEAGIKGVNDASILNKFFDTSTITAALFRFGDTYQPVKTDVSYDRIIEAFSEGRSFHAIIPSLGDSKYQYILSSGIMLTPVTVTKDFCTFIGEGVLGKYELVMFNSTEEGGSRGYQTYGFIMSTLPKYGIKIYDIEHKEDTDCVEGDVIGDIYDVEISIREAMLKSTDGKLYRCIGTKKVSGVKMVDFQTSYLKDGEVVNDFYTLIDNTFEVGGKTYTTLEHNAVSPVEGNFYIDFTTDPDAEFDEDTIKRLELEYFVDENSLAAYNGLKTEVTLAAITEAYKNNRSIYARIMDEGEPVRLFEAMSILTDDDDNVTMLHFYGHGYYEQIDNYIEVSMDADNAIMGIRPLAPTPVYVTVLRLKDDELTDKQREEKAENENIEFFRFKESTMNTRKLYSLWESGRDTYLILDSNSDALIKLTLPVLFKLDMPWKISENNIIMSYVCHNLLTFQEVVISLTQKDGVDVETIQSTTVPYVTKSDMDEALAERDTKIEELETKLSYAEEAFEEIQAEINYMKSGNIIVVNNNDWPGSDFDTIEIRNPLNKAVICGVPRDEMGILNDYRIPDDRQIIVNTNAIEIGGQTSSHEVNDTEIDGVPYWSFNIPSGTSKIILKVWDY